MGCQIREELERGEKQGDCQRIRRQNEEGAGRISTKRVKNEKMGRGEDKQLGKREDKLLGC